MKNFNIEAEISGKVEALTIVAEEHKGEKIYRVIKDGVEFCTLKENGNMGWEVNGTPLNADELNDIGQQIKSRSV